MTGRSWSPCFPRLGETCTRPGGHWPQRRPLWPWSRPSRSRRPWAAFPIFPTARLGEKNLTKLRFFSRNLNRLSAFVTTEIDIGDFHILAKILIQRRNVRMSHDRTFSASLPLWGRLGVRMGNRQNGNRVLPFCQKGKRAKVGMTEWRHKLWKQWSDPLLNQLVWLERNLPFRQNYPKSWNDGQATGGVVEALLWNVVEECWIFRRLYQMFPPLFGGMATFPFSFCNYEG